MRRIERSAFLALGFCIAAACGPREDVRVAVDTRLIAPRTVLEKADKLELRVLEGGTVSCDPAKGVIADDSTAKEIARQDLGDSGCASGIRFCGNLSIEKSDAMRVFGAEAKDAAGEIVAIGCGSAKVDQDNVPLSITMLRYLEPEKCGDGKLQPTEQCEPAGGAVCDDECHSKEILLSTGSTGNKTDTGGPGDKADPFFSWSAGSGNAGRFLAFFTDKKTGTSNNTDVGVRAMGDALAPLGSPPALAGGSIFLSSGGSFPPDAAPFRQSVPQAAALGGKTWVVFQDDNSPGAFGLDIHLRALDDTLQAASGEAIVINGAGAPPTGEAGIQSSASIAAGKSSLFIAWEDVAAGKVAGRTLTPPSTLGSQIDVSTGNANSQPSVAQTGDDFVIVWKSGTGIRFRKVNAAGVPQGADAAVSEGGSGFDRPRVASLSDGRFAVAWIADGKVFVQRFDSKAAKVGAAEAVDDAGSAQTGVAIASTPAASGSYVVAWIDGGTSHARARFVGGTSGFLFNNVDGQSTSFQASLSDGRTRANAAVAVGGTAPFVAIGWEDKGSAPTAGIVARRFPLPTE
jgi:hypothetical protein